ncbi:MAG: hypothetical protein OMM_04712 [Candidatus Magnetoglobus multicellularis str. Araruama]|uniref:Uncharacterized protein n=1 Tax=Candidatus Magnetoglobus multicellularis str. Araruama TaxID=890399 RepID=A0A1V1NZZ1_9BACT|nr:MAG: hypothetical protein OMM_04712 [Candidatus Magnetoglobus multicellularis str. Araruama]
MYIRIPLAYQRFIRVIKSRKDTDLAKFVFDFSKVDANKSKQGEIPIIATCADGLEIHYNLPFQFSTYAVSPETPFQCPDWKCGKSEELYIHLHNNTSTPFEVQDIQWKKNNFTRKLRLSEINEQFPVRLENSSKTIRFQPIIKGSWYKEVVINDILQIKSNLKDCPVFEKEYTIRLSRNKWYYRILKKISNQSITRGIYEKKS